MHLWVSYGLRENDHYFHNDINQIIVLWRRDVFSEVRNQLVNIIYMNVGLERTKDIIRAMLKIYKHFTTHLINEIQVSTQNDLRR